jgi:hypothetical protein
LLDLSKLNTTTPLQEPIKGHSSRYDTYLCHIYHKLKVIQGGLLINKPNKRQPQARSCLERVHKFIFCTSKILPSSLCCSTFITPNKFRQSGHLLDFSFQFKCKQNKNMGARVKRSRCCSVTITNRTRKCKQKLRVVNYPSESSTD